MRELVYPGDRLWGTEDIHFGERVFFAKEKRSKEMVIKKDGCDLYELENVLSQYIEKDELKTFVSKICGNEYKHKEEYFYVRQYMPEVPMGTLCMLIPSKKYYINMRLSTLWILCVLLDINITKGWAVALGSMGGKLKQIVYKINEENAEKCVLLELIRSDEGTFESKKECFNNHFRCKYRDDCGMCIIEEKDILLIIQSLIDKGIITRIGNTYKYIF